MPYIIASQTHKHNYQLTTEAAETPGRTVATTAVKKTVESLMMEGR
jgi:hypothetical protein